MRIREICEWSNKETRSDYDWYIEKSQSQSKPSEQLYSLLDKNGKVVRRHVSLSGINAALKMPHYRKIYGKMSYRKE